MARGKQYPEEFKKDAVELVLSSPERPVADIARSLGVHKATLGTWVERELGRRRKAAGNDGGDAAVSREVEALKAQVRELDRLLSDRNHELAHARQDIDILQRAAAYFARETGQ
ncbi:MULTISPECIES: transposase [unclassified Streptomyces]|uniref:transposase n=1 Tax=unclassified Streptomyces TaxID=2593676 RepID=UPI000CD4D421|nr:transposase [Streptomyces sp. SM10]